MVDRQEPGDLSAGLSAHPATAPARLVIASRQSRLALWQAEHVKARLADLYPSCSIEILGMTTEGDRVLDRALTDVGGKGLFTKELEVALADGRADLAVHSLKDVPMQLPVGFSLAAVLKREDPRDAFVSNHHAGLADLPAGSRIGTSSLRRAAQVKARFPLLEVKTLRGNVNTRLAKLDRGDYDAILLAAAGLKRLGMAERIRAMLSPAECLPAAGQGALAIETLVARAELINWLAPLTDRSTLLQITAERAVSRALGGSCRTPLAAYCEPLAGDHYRLTARVASLDGTETLEAHAMMAAADLQSAEALGADVAQQLIARGAQRLLAPAT